MRCHAHARFSLRALSNFVILRLEALQITVGGEFSPQTRGEAEASRVDPCIDLLDPLCGKKVKPPIPSKS